MRLLWERTKNKFQNILHLWRSDLLEYFYEDNLKQSLVLLAPVVEGDFVLDLGCGSGQTTCWINERFEAIKIIGVDSNSRKIKKARQQAKKRELVITFISFSGYAFPFPDAGFDKVLICFLEKPVPIVEYHNALEEIYRVLRSQGEMLFAQWEEDNQITEDQQKHSTICLKSLLQQVGFLYRGKLTQFTTPWGTIGLYKAKKHLYVHR